MLDARPRRGAPALSILAMALWRSRSRRAARTRRWSTNSVARRAAQAQGRPLARVETEYNDIFITKRRNELTMSFQLKGWDYTESVTNLRRSRRPAGALHAGA